MASETHTGNSSDARRATRFDSGYVDDVKCLSLMMASLPFLQTPVQPPQVVLLILVSQT